MEALTNLLTTLIKRFDGSKLLREIMSDERFKDYYIQLNQEQLYEDGKDSNDNFLEPYSRFTVAIKRKKGQPSDRTTLKDTGKFYRSFKITVNSGGFTIDADGQKDNINLFDRYGIDILGLNQMNTFQFQNLIASEIKNRILQIL